MYSVSGPLEWVLQKVRAGVIFGVRIISLPGPSRGGAAEKWGSARTDGGDPEFNRVTKKMCIINVRKCGKRKKNQEILFIKKNKKNPCTLAAA